MYGDYKDSTTANASVPTTTTGGGHTAVDVTLVGTLSGVGTKLAPAVYIAPATSLATYSGASWLMGDPFPTGNLAALSFVVDWLKGGGSSKINYRIRVGHDSTKMAITPIRDGQPSVTTFVATTTEYESIIRRAEVGTDTVFPVQVDLTPGWTYVALDIQQAVVDGGGNGTVGVTIAGTY